MFGSYSDALPIDTRHQLFNTLISHKLKSMIQNPNPKPDIVLLQIDLCNEDDTENILSNEKLSDVIKIISDKGDLITDRQLELLNNEDINVITVALLAVSPRGTPNLSVWAFTREEINAPEPIILGEWPLVTKKNP